MSGDLKFSHRARRRAATQAEIVTAAWQLGRAHGLSGVSMRDLGAAVGMSAQSIYFYFASKDEIYDVMFADGYRAASAHLAPYAEQFDAAGTDPVDLVEAIRASAHGFFEFCVSDHTRYELLFQRTIRGFAPSAESYTLASEFLDLLASRLARLGVEQAGIDLWTAVMSGLTSQHLANDAGTGRWEELLDGAVDMLILRLLPNLHRRATAKIKRSTR